MDYPIVMAFLLGLLSACSLPLGTITSAVIRPGDRLIAFLMAFGGGALLAALTIDLVASSLDKGHFTPLAIGCIIGGILFVVLNEAVNDYGGFVRKASTTFYYLRKEDYKLSKRILTSVRQMDIFKGLSQNHYKVLAASMTSLTYRKGSMIYVDGDPSESLYIISDGKVELLDPYCRMAVHEKLENGDAFGWMDFLTGAPHTMAAIAKTDVTVWVLPRGTFFAHVPNSKTLLQSVHLALRDKNVSKYLHDRHGLSNEEAAFWSDRAIETLLSRGTFSEAVMVKRNSDEFLEIADKIQRFSLFQSLPFDEIEEISNLFIYRFVPEGYTLYHKGDRSDRLYFIDKGQISLIDPGMTLRQTERLSAFSGFGGKAFITGARHTTSAITTQDVHVWILRKQDFDKVLEYTPVLATKLKQYINENEISNYLLHKQHYNSVLIERWKRKAITSIDSSASLPLIIDMSFEIEAHKGAPLAIWLGILLDGIPESLVIGASLIQSHISFSLIGGLFLSNYPEALSSSIGMRQQGFSFRRILFMWTSLMVITGIGSALGNVFFTEADPAMFSLVEGIAAGAMLTMITQTMLPEAYIKGGSIIGFSTLLGFLSAILLKTLE